MTFELFVDPSEESFVLKHADIIRQKLTSALLLLLQEIHADDLRRTRFIGHGIDPAAIRHTADVQERKRLEHEATFPR